MGSLTVFSVRKQQGRAEIKEFGARAGIILVASPESLCLGFQPGVIQPDLMENNEAFNAKTFN